VRPASEPGSAIDLAPVVRAAFDWVRAVAVDTATGLGWLEDDQPFDDLYSGTAGVLLAASEATAAGFDASAIASGALERLLNLDAGSALPDDGLFSGWAGVVVALRSWAQVSGDARADAGATRLSRDIAARVQAGPRDLGRFTDIISGDAGIVLALVAEDDAVDALTPAIAALADGLVALAEPAPAGWHWRMTADTERLMPGFSHGTAGVAFALAAASSRLNRPDLLAAAIRGAEALLAVGDTPSGWAVPATIPSQRGRPPVNFGWCHGPTGTVRLFIALDAVDPQPRWQSAIEACLQALRDSQVPARLYPGYWDNLGRCCGTAGVGELLLERYLATGDLRLLGWAQELAADVLARGQSTEQGLTWSNTEHTRTPSELAPEPGFMQGTAGIAAWLARLHWAAHDPDSGGSAPDVRSRSSTIF
jgi:lantibiotic modifying enzyme